MAIKANGRLVKAEHFQDLSALPEAPLYGFGTHEASARDGTPDPALAPLVRRQFGIRLPMTEAWEKSRSYYAQDLALLKSLVA